TTSFVLSTNTVSPVLPTTDVDMFSHAPPPSRFTSIPQVVHFVCELKGSSAFMPQLRMGQTDWILNARAQNFAYGEPRK
ncbi:MAG TPA: hypothetical protein VMR81_00005, partial [Patescibacteria group bacterium]|nr:hypothetical protein [Patescibacteria group bacterium]